ncbi:MAG: YlmC/YmxH family sporulation protein [Firmicutes bacterium]|nr:YlmC/YmxH family sporulation protein [Bacillota bacterium]
MVKISDLRNRDVVNVNDGKRLGFIQDLDIDLEKGMIKALIVPAGGGLLGRLGGAREHIVPWEKVIKIGVDTILVDLPDQPFQKTRTVKNDY